MSAEPTVPVLADLPSAAPASSLAGFQLAMPAFPPAELPLAVPAFLLSVLPQERHRKAQ